MSVNITKGQVILGFPALVVRAALRHTVERQSSIERIEYATKLSAADARTLVDRLLDAGYLERTVHLGVELLETSQAGLPLARARADRPISRAVAQRQVDDLLARIRHINTNQKYAWRVIRVVLFGSYVKGADKVNDIDAVMTLAQRWPNDPGKQWKAMEARRDAYKGAHRDWFERIFWGEIEVTRFLRGRGNRFEWIYVGEFEGMKVPAAEQQVIFDGETPTHSKKAASQNRTGQS